MVCGAVIPAAGQARRFGHGDKTFVELAERPLLEWTLRAMIDAGALAQIVVAVSESNHFPVINLIASLQSPIPISTVRGGDSRMESVAAGVRALTDESDLVLIHDAARPVVSIELIRSVIDNARAHGAVIPGTPVTDTIKLVRGEYVTATVDRSELVAVQTPQVFRKDWLLAAYDLLARETEATDEAAILELAGYHVRVIPGESTNIKVTTTDDVRVAEMYLSDRESAR
ncbi:MAG: 2-C-methyl-D-erythritol 4-phosphate cytidylyltransferase [Thermomicrobiaceae bacterium]